MTLTFEPLHPIFAARVRGLDMHDPVDEARRAELIAAMDRYAVLACPHETPLSSEEQIAFSAHMGPMDRVGTPKVEGTGIRLPFSEITDQSNMDQDGVIYAEGDRRLAFKRANRLWHTDMSYRPIRATYSLLSAHVIPPEGGNTEFIDMRAVYDDLPDTMKARLDGLVGEHSYWYSRKQGGGPDPTPEERAGRPPARHKLVHVHPTSGRKVLYIASHIEGIVGWAQDEARALIDELMATAIQPKYIFSYAWAVGDVVIWDNLATLHRATPFDDQKYKRDMRRTTCRERPVNQ